MEPCKFVLYLPILKLEIAKNPNANHGILLPFMSNGFFQMENKTARLLFHWEWFPNTLCLGVKKFKNKNTKKK